MNVWSDMHPVAHVPSDGWSSKKIQEHSEHYNLARHMHAKKKIAKLTRVQAFE